MFNILDSLAESRQYETLAEKNSQSAQLWKAMPEEEKKKFKEEAGTTNSGFKPLNPKQETRKILSHLEDIVSAYFDNLRAWYYAEHSYWLSVSFI